MNYKLIQVDIEKILAIKTSIDLEGHGIYVNNIESLRKLCGERATLLVRNHVITGNHLALSCYLVTEKPFRHERSLCEKYHGKECEHVITYGDSDDVFVFNPRYTVTSNLDFKHYGAFSILVITRKEDCVIIDDYYKQSASILTKSLTLKEDVVLDNYPNIGGDDIFYNNYKCYYQYYHKETAVEHSIPFSELFNVFDIDQELVDDHFKIIRTNNKGVETELTDYTKLKNVRESIDPTFDISVLDHTLILIYPLIVRESSLVDIISSIVNSNIPSMFNLLQIYDNCRVVGYNPIDKSIISDCEKSMLYTRIMEKHRDAIKKKLIPKKYHGSDILIYREPKNILENIALSKEALTFEGHSTFYLYEMNETTRTLVSLALDSEFLYYDSEKYND